MQKYSTTEIVKYKTYINSCRRGKYSNLGARANLLYFLHSLLSSFTQLVRRHRRGVSWRRSGPGEEIIKIHRFENRMEKRYEEKWGRGVARCIGGTSSRLRVLSGHGNRCQLFFSFPPLRRASSNLSSLRPSAWIPLDRGHISPLLWNPF